MTIIITLLIAAVVGGGTSMVAENALPGDLLYPVKISINEEVRAALAFSGGAKADWEARRAERRLEEAAKLAEKGELKAEVLAKIESNFSAHADRVKTRIQEMEARGQTKAAVDLATKFEQSLQSHQDILVKLSAKAEAGGRAEGDVSGLSIKVRDVLGGIGEIRAKARAKIGGEEVEEIEEETEGTDEELEVEAEIETEAEAGGEEKNKEMEAETRAKGKIEVEIGL